MDFTTKIQTIPEDLLDSLFNSSDTVVPPTTPEPPAQEPPKADPTPAAEPQAQSKDIPVLDVDKLEVEDSTDPAAAQDNTNPEAPKADMSQEEINNVLKSTVDFLVDRGFLPETAKELDINDEVYADLVIKNAEDKALSLFDQLVDSTGVYGEVIINHIKAGGNPDEVIDLFKEQKQNENLDLSQPRSQTEIIKRYYSDVVGWKPEKIEKYISTLESSDGGLEEEAKEVQGKFDEMYQKQLDDIKQQQKEFNEKQKQALVTRRKEQQEYVSKLVTTIDSDKALTAKDKKLVKDSMLKFNKKLEDGTPINDFYYKFYEMQKDPEQFVKLVHYVMDTQAYDERVKASKEVEDVDKKWKFVTKNNAVSKTSGATPDAPQKDSKPDLSFSGYLKR